MFYKGSLQHWLIVLMVASLFVGFIEGWVFSLKHKAFGLVGNVLIATMGALLGVIVGAVLGFVLFSLTSNVEGVGLLVVLAVAMAAPIAGAVVGGMVLLRITRLSISKRQS